MTREKSLRYLRDIPTVDEVFDLYEDRKEKA